MRVLALITLALAASSAAARKVWATIPYTVQGSETVLGADGTRGKWELGSRVLSSKVMSDPRGKRIGQTIGECTVAAVEGNTYVALCTKHFNFDDGGAMIAHYTERVVPGQLVRARAVLAGGIGANWEGAHGEDVSYVYNPKTGRGSGKIELFCLKGRC